jgi:quinol monooxygenase YgiN
MALHSVLTRYIAKPKQGNGLIDILLKCHDIVSDAEGCRHYIINQDDERPDHIWVSELWDSQEDHIISLSLDGCKELDVAINHLLAAPPEQIMMKAVAGKGVEEYS